MPAVKRVCNKDNHIKKEDNNYVKYFNNLH